MKDSKFCWSNVDFSGSYQSLHLVNKLHIYVKLMLGSESSIEIGLDM